MSKLVLFRAAYHDVFAYAYSGSCIPAIYLVTKCPVKKEEISAHGVPHDANGSRFNRYPHCCKLSVCRLRSTLTIATICALVKPLGRERMHISLRLNVFTRYSVVLRSRREVEVQSECENTMLRSRYLRELRVEHACYLCHSVANTGCLTTFVCCGYPTDPRFNTTENSRQPFSLRLVMVVMALTLHSR